MAIDKNEQTVQTEYNTLKSNNIYFAITSVGIITFFAGILLLSLDLEFSRITFFLFPLIIMLGVELFICGAVGLRFGLSLFKICSLKTTAVSLSISAITSCGIYCVLSYISCYFLTTPERHPIRYPASFFSGCICFFAFCALIYIYIKLRKNNKSIKGIVVDVLLNFMSLPFFFTAAALLDIVLTNIVHYCKIFE